MKDSQSGKLWEGYGKIFFHIKDSFQFSTLAKPRTILAIGIISYILAVAVLLMDFSLALKSLFALISGSVLCGALISFHKNKVNDRVGGYKQTVKQPCRDHYIEFDATGALIKASCLNEVISVMPEGLSKKFNFDVLYAQVLKSRVTGCVKQKSFLDYYAFDLPGPAHFYEFMKGTDGHIYLFMATETQEKGIVCSLKFITPIYQLFSEFSQYTASIKHRIHDLNNILAIIDGYTRVTMPMIEDKTKARQNLEKISKTLKKGCGISRSILRESPSSHKSAHTINSKKEPQFSPREYIGHGLENEKEFSENDNFKKNQIFLVRNGLKDLNQLLLLLKEQDFEICLFWCLEEALSKCEVSQVKPGFLILSASSGRISPGKGALLFEAVSPETRIIFAGDTQECFQNELENYHAISTPYKKEDLFNFENDKAKSFSKHNNGEKCF